MEPNQHCHKSVVNLSTFQLDEHHISVLSRGLKFCPTPGPPDPGELRDNMDCLHKRLRQIAFYEGSESIDGDLITPSRAPVTPEVMDDNLLSFEPFKHRKFKLKASGQGPPGPPTLEAMIACNEHQYNARPAWQPSKRSNLTPAERTALRELANNDNIVIKPADKG